MWWSKLLGKRHIRGAFPLSPSDELHYARNVLPSGACPLLALF
jgi:hypothetical protein